MPKERKLPLCGLLPLLTMPATGVRQVRTITFCFLYSTIIPNPPLPVKGEIAFLSPYFFRAPGLHFSPPPPPARGRHTGRRPPRLRRGKRAPPVSAAPPPGLRPASQPRLTTPPHHPTPCTGPPENPPPPQMLPNYPGNKSPVPPISYANQTPVCKTSVNKCCFLTLPMQKPPVFAVLVEGLFPPRPKNLPLPLSSPRRLWYNIPWTFANISKR